MVVIITHNNYSALILLKNQQRQESDGIMESGDVQDIKLMATVQYDHEL